MMIQEKDIQIAVNKYVKGLDQPFNLKGIFFDMDGVLFNSMPNHAKAWHQAFTEQGVELPEYEPYMNEGSTAFYTVKKMFKKYKNIESTDEMAEQVKQLKHEIMKTLPKSEVMNFMPGLLSKITKQGIDCWVVTGSAQRILIDRLDDEFNGNLQQDKMITAYDVKIGKPHPEPYLMAMQKSGYKINESIVVENAPLGVESGKAAGLFTIAINTGPIDPQVLADAGADIVLSGSQELDQLWPIIYKTLNSAQ